MAKGELLPTIAEALADAQQRLGASETAHLDAQVLLAHVLARPRSYLLAWPERELGEAELAAFRALVAERAAGRPVAQLTGRREFWSLELAVDEHTLIPRPETELLVERALARAPASGSGVIADLGTGSGAVALALASERPGWRIVATERSDGALAVARANLRRLDLRNVSLRRGDWCAPLAGERFALIVSNPPYVPASDPHLQRGDVRFEPRDALVSGPEGLDDIRRIADCARAHLDRGGWLLVEHGADQGEAVAGIFRGLGYRNVATYRDLSGHERVTEGQLGHQRPDPAGDSP